MNYKKYLNSFVLIALFLVLSFILRYAFICNDDIDDFFPYNWCFFHGRILTELMSYIFIKVLPTALNINMQDFAIISGCLLKTTFYTWIVYIISCSYNKFKETPLIRPVITIISFILIYAVISQNDFIFSLHINEYYQGYITPIIIYLLLWYTVKNFYIEDKINIKEIIILLVLAILNLTSTEQFTVAGLLLIIFVIIDLICNYVKTKDIQVKEKIKYLILIFTASLIILAIIAIKPSTIKELWETFGLTVNLNVEIVTVKHFLYVYTKKIILQNIYFIIPLIVNIILLVKLKSYEVKQIRYIAYSLIGFLIFQAGAIFIPATCYSTNEPYKFWFLHCGYITEFQICLYFFSLYITGYTYSKLYNNINYRNIVISLFIASSLLYLCSVKYIKPIYADKEAKQLMYISDKFTNFYLRQNKTAILPNTVPFEIVQGIDPKDLANNDEIYTKKYENISYLRYINYSYNIDITQGVTFLPNEEAIQIYKENGGILTEDELNKLEFKYIEKQFD